MLFIIVSPAKDHFEKQTLVEDSKQSKQPDKADRLTRQAG
jgi:hypothetical protein